MNTAGNDMPSNKGGNPQRRKPVRMTFNFSWFYIILIIGIIWMFFNQGGANPQKIEWTDVKEQIKAGDVKEIVFIRNDFEGRVTIKPRCSEEVPPLHIPRIRQLQSGGDFR